QIENLVTGRFVGEAQAIADHAARTEDQQIGSRRSRAKTLSAQLVGFALEQKSPAARNEIYESFGRNGFRVRLSDDRRPRPVVERVSDAQLIMLDGMQRQGRAAVRDQHRLMDSVNGPPRWLHAYASPPDGVDELLGRAVQARGFGTIELYQAIID